MVERRRPSARLLYSAFVIVCDFAARINVSSSYLQPTWSKELPESRDLIGAVSSTWNKV